jgi:hypothetical protein
MSLEERAIIWCGIFVTLSFSISDGCIPDSLETCFLINRNLTLCGSIPNLCVASFLVTLYLFEQEYVEYGLSSDGDEDWWNP